jgi:ubiquinone/menaquinone biosynthesis C-methylase UbiE
MHIDIGSRIDGFIAHILPFCKVKYVDIRPLNSQISNLEFVQGSLLELPFESNSIESLSCLHVIEHIGLGRYGDEVDSEGYIKAAIELTRVLKPGGVFYFSTPVGEETLYFDAHRIFSPNTVLDLFKDLKFIEFNLIDDLSHRIIKNASFEMANNCVFGCGLFIFTK